MPQVAVFDTAFHQTLPPARLHLRACRAPGARSTSIRRYGFHGTSYAFVAAGGRRRCSAGRSRTPNLVVLHLGNGASATAIRGGESVDTSMGLTPLEGLVMGTRSGDLDPAVHGHLHRELGWSLEEIDRAAQPRVRAEGLAGAQRLPRGDRRAARAATPAARLAFDVYCYRIRKYVGAYYAVLGTVDAVVFTAGVGRAHAAAPCAPRRCPAWSGSGIAVDPDRNARLRATARVVSPDGSDVAVLVVPTNEEWEIARQAVAVVEAAGE